MAPARMQTGVGLRMRCPAVDQVYQCDQTDASLETGGPHPFLAHLDV